MTSTPSNNVIIRVADPEPSVLVGSGSRYFAWNSSDPVPDFLKGRIRMRYMNIEQPYIFDQKYSLQFGAGSNSLQYNVGIS